MKATNTELELLRREVAALREFRSGYEAMQAALREQEEWFAMLFQSSSNPMILMAPKDLRIFDVNDACLRMSGYAREELLNHSAAEFLALTDPEPMDQMAQMIQAQGRAPAIELCLHTKMGIPLAVMFYAVPIKRNGEVRLFATIVDVTLKKREADALRASEEKYRRLVETSLQGLSIIQDSRYVFCNTTFAGMLGYSVQELLELQNLEPLVHPDDRRMIWARYQDRLAGKPAAQHYEYRILRKDGTERWVEAFASLIDYEGRSAIETVHLDITERKRASDQLRQLANEQKTILNTLGTGICYLKKRRIQWINPAFANMFDYPIESLRGTDTSILYVHPEDYQSVGAAGYPMLARGLTYATEVLMKKRDGSSIWCAIAGRAVDEDPEQGTIWALTDITERRQTEEALRASEERFKRLVQNSNDIIAVLDGGGRITHLGGPVDMILGYSPEDLIGAEVFSRIHPDDLHNARTVFQDIKLRQADSYRVECRYLHKEGAWIPVEVVGSNLLQDPVVRGIVLNIRDISERKKLQEQLQQAIKMEAVGMLAGGVAHDFNNLLNVINGYCELLLDDCVLEDKTRDEIALILQAGQKAASLTSQLLAFSRKQILQPIVLNLNDSITEMSAMLRRLIGEDIKLAVVTQPGLGWIHADPGQMQQIIMNLAVNARDAMPQGGRLTIETANVDLDKDYFRDHPPGASGPYVMLAISDTGEGMDAAVREHLFEPFFTTKEKGRGTGLGLSTVYGIVKQSNGLIWVYSEVGKGTTFKIYFPRLEGANEAAVIDTASPTQFCGSETILVVEDEDSVRALAARILGRYGYSVLAAASGEEALALARAHAGEIGLVMADVVMPGMSGRDLVAQLSAMLPGLKALFVSGYPTNAIGYHGILDAGVSFLQKPFTVEGLIRKVREVLDR